MAEWSWKGEQRLSSQTRLHAATGQQSGEHYGVAEEPRLEWWGDGAEPAHPLAFGAQAKNISSESNSITLFESLRLLCVHISMLYDAFVTEAIVDNDWMRLVQQLISLFHFCFCVGISYFEINI